MTIVQNQVGITEASDPSFDLRWISWVFENKRPAILITKDPSTLYDHLIKLEENQQYTPNIIVHCTITGMGGSVIEPNAPTVDNSLEGYKKLVEHYGVDRVVLRCGPIFPNYEYVDKAIDQVINKHLGTRVRIEFLMLNKFIATRLMNAGIDLSTFDNFDPYTQDTITNWDKYVKYIESKMRNPELLDLCFGFGGRKSSPCLGERELGILGVTPLNRFKLTCGCLGCRVELLDAPSRCKFGCLYCVHWEEN